MTEQKRAAAINADTGEQHDVRLDYAAAAPHAIAAMSGLEKVVESSTREPRLRELVKLRASQINGCAYCVDMHTKDARAIGEDEPRPHTDPIA
jgi:AhpD family alkylhydroperoxidase